MKNISLDTKKINPIFAEYETTLDGLSSAQVEARLHKYGPNEVGAKSVYWWQLLWRQFNSPFIFLLFAAAVLSFCLGEKVDGYIVIAFIIINAALGFTQEHHSQKTLQLLKKFVVTEARVRRGGKEEMVLAATLVPGDVVIVEAGDIIPADIYFFETNDLLIDETTLTGESVPVEKGIDASGFSGTVVMSGIGRGVVTQTGKQTSMGKITKLTVETNHMSAFEKSITKFSTFILRMILVILVLVFVVNILLKGSETNIFELLLFSVALAVSVVPEALPVVTTIALSKGAMKLAKHKVVVKRLSAVEDLGSIEILCTDKTGTLTENKLEVDGIFAEDEKKTLCLAAIASSEIGNKKHESNNAFDIALWNKLTSAEQAHARSYKKVSEIPFDPVRKRNSVLVKHHEGCELIVRGAPEVIMDLCNHLTTKEKKVIEEWLAAAGNAGNRVIALAARKVDSEECHTVQDEHNLTFVGVISFVDPVKNSARDALQAAKKLGLSIKILTGDSKEVAGTVAQKVGLITSRQLVITGDEFEALSLEEQEKQAHEIVVFARVSPEQKYHIIELLQKKSEVGFLGEGINDAPAMKIANVGIAVSNASDIAREAADIILLKKSLSVVVDGIAEGREIFANTVKYIKATLISNFGNFYAIAIASLLVSYLPMLAVQILLLNLLSDFPMIAIATDTVDAEELRRPRSYNVREIVLISIILGMVSTVFDFIFFAVFSKMSPATLQTNWFIGSVLTELVLIFSIRTHRFFLSAKPPALGLAALSLFACISAIFVPFTKWGRHLFSFSPPSPLQLGFILTIVVAYFVVTEGVKMLYYKYLHRLKP